MRNKAKPAAFILDIGIPCSLGVLTIGYASLAAGLRARKGFALLDWLKAIG